uniref:Embryonic stem cell-related gene protein n=1 Tax=Homo sapiens TaxID=9606 RepID=ESRG_HUMAN|nr:RecName: Full=Embryonic stem cell-related gene protein; Short=hES cell-related gene protein [Homo sapiens]
MTLFSDSARLHPGEINSLVAHTKPVWWSLHTDAHEIWCRDSDRGTSLGRSIPCPPALCSVRKIHLRPQVLRPTSPRNISPISNPVSGLFLLCSPTSLTIPQPLSPFNLGATLQSLPSLNFNSFHSLVETKETCFIREPKTPAPVTDWEGSLPLVFNHCRDASLISRFRPRRDACLGPSPLAASPAFLGQGQVPLNPFSFTLSGKSRFSGAGASTPQPLLLHP